MSYQTPFSLTHPILSLVAGMAELIGKSDTSVKRVSTKLQREGKLEFIGQRIGEPSASIRLGLN